MRCALLFSLAAWDLGLGESQVLSWIYQNPGYEAILDDRAAKNAAASLGIPVRGTLGVILLAKREGRVESNTARIRAIPPSPP